MFDFFDQRSDPEADEPDIEIPELTWEPPSEPERPQQPQQPEGPDPTATGPVTRRVVRIGFDSPDWNNPVTSSAPGKPPPRLPGGRPRADDQRRRGLAIVLILAIIIAGAVLVLSRSGGGHAKHAAHRKSPPTSNIADHQNTPAGVSAAWMQAENARPGSDGWHLTVPARHHEIEGYADHASINLNDPASLYVSTTAPSFHVEAYRMGSYQGHGARLLWQSQDLPGKVQAKPTVATGVNMVEAHWEPSLQLPTSGWPEGTYLFKLVASTGPQQYVPLTIRNDASNATYMIIDAVTTWQAYNRWGGYSLYLGATGKGADFAQRARVVSFDRPYDAGDGAADYLGLEYPMVSFTEGRGLDITYITDVDLHEHPDLLLHHRAVFSMGHDEYYSTAMRLGMQAARDHGVNLAFLGANAMYRHIRFSSSPLGPDRHVTCYKSAIEDPLRVSDPAEVTVNWRDPPNNQPESTIIGDFYQCNPVRADMVVAESSNWLFAGSGATDGQRLPNVIGSEYDRYDPAVPSPQNVEIVAHSPLTCRGKPDYSDVTYYAAPSGAGVFASGTIDFVGNTDPNCPAPACPGHVLGKVMENLLVAFGAGPAGQAHPSVPNYANLPHPPPPAKSGGPPTTARE